MHLYFINLFSTTLKQECSTWKGCYIAKRSCALNYLLRPFFASATRNNVEINRQVCLLSPMGRSSNLSGCLRFALE